MQNATRKLAAGVAVSILLAAIPAKAESPSENWYMGIQDKSETAPCPAVDIEPTEECSDDGWDWICPDEYYER